MKLLLVLVMMISNESFFSNHLSEWNGRTDIATYAVTDTAFARVYADALPAEDGKTTRSLLHEFDCSVPKWKKDLPITAFEISKNIELVIYESKNYKGDYKVYNHLNSKGLSDMPEKFSFPGSIKVLYNGNKDCISTINQYSEDAIEYVSVEDQMEEIINADPQVVEHGIYVVNRHPSKAVLVRYKFNGRNQRIFTARVSPAEKKRVIGYVLKNPKSVAILGAKYLNE